MTDNIINGSMMTQESAQAIGRMGNALEPFREPLADEIAKAEPLNDKFIYGFDALKGHLLARHAGDLDPMFAALAAGPDGPIGKIVTDSLKGMIRAFSGVEPNYKAPHYGAYIGGRPDFVLAQKAFVSTDPDEFESLWDGLIGETIVHMNRFSTLLEEAMRYSIDSVFRDLLSPAAREVIPVVTDLPTVAGALSMMNATWRPYKAFTQNEKMRDTLKGMIVYSEIANANNIIGALTPLPDCLDDSKGNNDEVREEALRDAFYDSQSLERPFEYMNGGHAQYLTQYLKGFMEKNLVELPSLESKTYPKIRPGDPILVRRAIRRIMESIATTYEAADPVARADATVQVGYHQGPNAISFVEHGGVALLSGLAEGTSSRARLGSIADQMTGGGRLAFSQGRIDLVLPAFKGPFSPAISGTLWSAPPIPRTAFW